VTGGDRTLTCWFTASHADHYTTATICNNARMKRLLTGLVFVLLLAAPASATEIGSYRSFGLGLQLGSPTGFTGKAFLDRASAIDFGLGWRGYGWHHDQCWDDKHHYTYDCGYGWNRHNWTVHLDYLWENPITQGSTRLDWHIGLGGRLIFWEDGWYYDHYGEHHDVGAIIRMPLGLDLTFQRPSFLELFFEIAPGLLVIPDVDLDIDADIGIRFYF
jgi:hypothetical protein